MNIANIETPALIVDKKVFTENQKKINSMLGGSMKLRPHFKSNKCPEVARFQIENGAKGITCAKLGEAEIAAAAGIEDVLIANQVVQPEKITALTALAKTCRLTVCVDNKENIIALSQSAKQNKATLHCLIEYEVGMNRCGVGTKEEVLSLAKLITESDGLVFDGIQAYAGQLSHEISYDIRKNTVEENDKKLKELKKYLEDNGIEVKIISGGSTGTSVLKGGSEVYNELQCGSYLFMDTSYEKLGLPFEQSLYVLATVIHTDADKVVLDAGVKSFGMDQFPPKLKDYPDIPLVFSEEHVQFELPGNNFGLNDKLLIVPGHCCTTVNTFDKMYVTEENEITAVWEIAARGKAQ